MHSYLTIKKNELDGVDDSWDYLYTIVNKYYEFQEQDPDNVIDNFNNDQHSLMAYTILDSQVCNGGFIQLIYNGYGGYIFESPLIDTLKEWGLVDTPNLLERLKPLYIEAGIEQKDGDSLEDFSQFYTDHPEFDEYDDSYCSINDVEIDQVKSYVEQNLDRFIIIEP